MGNVAMTASDVRLQANHIRLGLAVLFCSLPGLRDQISGNVERSEGSGTCARVGSWFNHRRFHCKKMETKSLRRRWRQEGFLGQAGSLGANRELRSSRCRTCGYLSRDVNESILARSHHPCRQGGHRPCGG